MNTPMYDDEWRRVVLARVWRRPAVPVRRPRCHDRRTRRIGWNVYRCPTCAARIWPERLYHRLMFRWNPFRRGEGSWRDLIFTNGWKRVPDQPDTSGGAW